MVKEPLIQAESLPRPDPSKLSEYPTLSLQERDRRFSLIRKMMKKNNVEALIVLQGARLDDPSIYFTNEWFGIAKFVLFPLEGDPIAFNETDPLVIDTFMKGEAYGIDSWIKDWRFPQESGHDWVGILRQRGLANSRIGIIGSGTFAHRTQDMIARGLTNTIKTALPKVTFVDLWKPFVQIMLVKSQEEVAMFRKAALALEIAAEKFVDACKPGDSVADIQKECTNALIPYGVDIWSLNFPVCSIAFGYYGGRGIAWLAHGLKPPIINKGDLIECELMANVGPLHAQVLIAVSIGKPSEEKIKLASLARESYEIGLKTIHPGITFGQLAEAMGEPNKREGAWQLSPLIHTLNPHEAVSSITVGIKNFTGLKERLGDVLLAEPKMQRGDLVIEQGMLFEFEPNSAYGRTYVSIGGNILVTNNGCEELNKIPTCMVVASA